MTRAELLRLIPSWESNDDDVYSTVAYDMLNRLYHGLISGIDQDDSLVLYSYTRSNPFNTNNKLVIHRINDVQYVLSRYSSDDPTTQLLSMRIGISILNDQQMAYPAYMESRHYSHPTLITWEDGNLLPAFTRWLRMISHFRYSYTVREGNAIRVFDPVLLHNPVQ